ncbi:hypothetical protein [Sulfuracidifex metallicus]|uniref:Uncharacterized protein n=1 Tax=Sulfuracidifex metallicus DSM 6482 = JCM 9184 TaxID=523847 RepID=A0A6A9QXJ8_SULME|nr:hypothetical protein [Sulfuracidifex metallicus]MUN29752.1 hypothetical protein [Sulfuracidifex metallicus DSM 6482 = JCM 9184]WOE51867.1 hypothetical protein RQ359_001210 [Sulfuracidifex metallicus DSM 6482 = JCM 9184]
METLSLASKKVVATLIRRVINQGETLTISELLRSFKISRLKLLSTLEMMTSIGLIEIQDDRIIRNGKASDYNLLFTSLEKKCQFSPRGDRAMRLTAEFTPLKDGIREKVHESNRFDVERFAKVVRENKIIRRNVIENRKNGSAKWEMDIESPTLIKLRTVFDPPLIVGEFVKYSFYTWDEGIYALTMKELHERYHLDYTMEGLVVAQPTHHIRIIADLPWKPATIEGMKGGLSMERGFSELEKIKEVHDLRYVNNRLSLEVWNPSIGIYYLMWRPPS